MYIELDIATARSLVRDANDLKNFSVRTTEGADPAELARALGSLGELDTSDHAWIDIDQLRAASGRADDPAWVTDFDAMVAYASSKGWVDEAGLRLRAHLDFRAPEA